MNAPAQAGLPAVSPRRTPNFSASKCYLDGALDERRLGRLDQGQQPRDRRNHRQRSGHGRCRSETRGRSGRPGVACVAREDCEGARAAILRKWYDLMMANQDDLGLLAHHRAGQAARGSEGRDRLRRFVHRVVRRGRQAHLRRRHSAAPIRQADPRAEAADRRLRDDYAVEFPERDDHAQGGPGARRRLHGRAEAREPDAVLGARARRACRARRHPERRVQRDHRQLARDRRRADREPDGAQAFVHRLDRESAAC